MSSQEYDAVRVEPDRFVVLPGHERAATDEVLSRADGFVVIVKHTDSEAVAPRQS